MYRFTLEIGTHKVCIMRGFGADDIKNVRIFRQTQASGTVITLDALYTDGEFKPLPEKNTRLRFSETV